MRTKKIIETKRADLTGSPGWPPVEDQLAAAKVARGSALEKLIRDNQDFHLLRPEEAHDRIGLPPWLRVHWRKQHPEGQYLADDASGGYPLVLKKIHTWMLAHHDLRSSKLKRKGRQHAH